MTTTVGFSSRWLAEYWRRPLNVVLLVAVPVVFVTLSAGALADFADILGGAADVGEVEAATAGWAAAVLAGVAGFFHVSQSRDADRRLAAAGAGAGRVVASRLVSTLTLAALASVGALIALAARTDVAGTGRVIGATALFALTYTGFGVLVGALVRSELNGSLIVVFAWIFDVFFGPAMGGTATVLRLFPLHFPTLVVTDVASGHSGALGDLGLSLLWAVAAMTAATVALVATTRPHEQATRQRSPARRRAMAGLGAAGRQLQRMPVMWILIIGLPVAFISVSIAVTPEDPTPVELVEGGRRGLSIISMADVHGAIMVPITIGFLASLAGLFVILDSAEADRRLSLTRFRPGEILGVRMTVIGAAALVATAVSIAVTAVSFDAVSWPIFIGANVLVALTYATIGVIVGPVFGRLGGLYLLLVLPFIDIGLAQNAMFDAAPPAWGAYMPAHGAVRVMMDGAFTPTFDETGALVVALAWLGGLAAMAALVFRRVTVR
ncbi:MAG: ABC transporter permease [Acidimicrobiales bacterium]|nr:ABC transporter permease [Acidimicrobiales bacterium]